MDNSSIERIDYKFTEGSLYLGFKDNGWEYIYVVMDFAEGQDLETVMKDRKFEMEEVIGIFDQILYGIGSICSRNLIHRDLKPANMYLLEDGNIKILDFGLSKLVDKYKKNHNKYVRMRDNIFSRFLLEDLIG